EVPDAGAFHDFVGHTDDGWLSGVNQGHLLAALSEVAASIGRPPSARGVESVAAVAGEVGHGPDDGDGHAAASVAGAGRVKGPGAGALDGLVGQAGNGWFRSVLHCQVLDS